MDPEPIPGILDMKQEYILDEMPYLKTEIPNWFP